MRSLLFIAALLCSLLSFASASITLSSNFQPFSGTSNDATSESNCRALYNSRIEACTDTVDFLNGNYCTSECQQALRNMEAKLNNFCRGVEADSGSLLAAIFGRKLVGSICRDGGAANPQSSPRVSTTTKLVSTKTLATTVTTATEDADDAEETTTRKVTSSSSVTVTIPSSSDSATTVVPLPTPTTQQPAPASTTITWREKQRQDQACAILKGGGGSPFDNMVDFNFPTDEKSKQEQLRNCVAIESQRAKELERKKSAGSHSKKPSSMAAIVIGVGIGLMLLA